MKFPSFSFTNDWKNLRKFEKIDLNEKQIVFYAENLSSFNHFRLLIEELTINEKIKVIYVTSVSNDEIFKIKNENLKIFFIGKGTARTKFFLTLKAKILIMDMPDLERFHIKKSKIYPVHYVYVFHSMFSIHTYLRKNALDDYDTIFCVGSHHKNEIKTLEKFYNLKSKNLIEYGFGRLDFLLKENYDFNDNSDNMLVIIAPSYGKNNLLENCGVELIQILLKNNFKIILRPHHKILNESNDLINEILKRFGKQKNFRLEKGVLDAKDFHNSLSLITDWSGIGIEYAFVREKRVIFIDVPQKILNEDFKEIDIEPFEKLIRTQIGHIISINELNKIPNIIKNENKIIDIKELRNKMIYNVGKSSKVGSAFIKKLYNA